VSSLKTTLLALVAALPLALSAQDTTRARPLDTLVVTAERRPVASTATPAVVRVITTAQLRAKGTADLATLLREVPGLQLDPVVGSGSGISIQGLGSDRVQVLLDGAPIEGRLNNQFDITRLDASQFQRIEIVEGPQSTLYGSTALGGVINLISRIPDGNHAELSTRGGTYGQLDVGGRLSALAGVTGLAFAGGHRHIDIAPGNAAGGTGSADRWNGTAAIVRPLGTAVLDVRATHTREEQEYLTSFGPGFLFANAAHNRQTDVLATLRTDADRTELRAHASVYNHTLDETDVASQQATSDPQSQHLADVELIRRGELGGGAWVAGIRGEHEWLRSARLTDAEENSTSGALYGSGEWNIGGGASVSTGARLTVAERWGTDVAPRIGFVWRGAGGLYAKTGLAHGFRAPSFTEQFSDFVNAEAFYAVKGNPDLKPESSWNLTGELGVRRSAAELYVRGFGNRLRNFIEANYTGQNGSIAQFTYANVGKARTAGVETGMSIRRGVLVLQGSYAFLDAHDETSDQPLLGRARHTVRGAISIAPARWSVTGEYVRASRLPLSQDPQTQAIVFEGASPRVNARASMEIGHQWRASTGVDNIGDVIPENAIAGFGRRWYAGLTWGR
jgi:outer membrane receptor for ferrienterochelin and colicins